jgi:exonuclease III
VVVGDLNCAFQDADVADHKKHRNKIAGFMDEERTNFGRLLREGELVDVWRAANPAVCQYTYFSVRNKQARAMGKGWRLDYALVRGKTAHSEIRSTFPGYDHMPISVDITL